MAFSCSRCSQLIPPADLNVQTDVALCRTCGHLGKVSDFVSTRVRPETVTSPPAGAWIRETFAGLQFGATTRSPIAFFLVPFMLVWSGGALGGIYGTQIVKGEFNLFMSLFGIPFLFGAVIFWSLTFMAIWGRVEVQVDHGRGTVFTGVWGLGRTRTFDLAAVDSITDEPTHVRYPGSRQRGITLSGRTRLSFGTGLSEERRHFMLQTLRALHTAKRR